MLLKNFYFNAAQEEPGRVYRVQDGVYSVFFGRTKGRIYRVLSQIFIKTKPH